MEAVEVAPTSGDGVGMASGLHVKEGFLLYGIDVFSDQTSVNLCIEYASSVDPHPANPSLSFLDEATMVAETTPDLALVPSLIEHGLFHGTIPP
jgi:hypothetical protein